MKNRRKLLTSCMVLTLFIGILSGEYIFANAAENTTSVQPRYSNMQEATLSFGIDSEGLACGNVVGSYYSSCTDYVQVRFQLQRYTEEEGWTSIYTTITNMHESPFWNHFSRNVTKGYTYRTVAMLDFYYNGSIAETVRMVSVTDTY